ncbi:MAG: hypothetical protein QM621_01675 [Aeromicrobium sp.]|uniref:hypothetical protein n=1 Tax=Aeromicrobium sp. TaxID=1871063 RepID=UPI0039E2E2B1
MLSLVLLVTGVMFTVVAWSTPSVETADQTAARSGELTVPSVDAPPEVRSLPLRSDADPIGEAFPHGIDDGDEAADLLVDLATPLGLGDDILSLAGQTFSPGDSAVLDDETYRPVHPYMYPSIDPVVESRLDLESAEKDPEAVLDLTAALILLAAFPPDEEQQMSFDTGAMVAYSILRHVQTVSETCEAQLQLAHVMSLGTPSDEHLSTEVEKARSLCPNDPTPLWISAQSRISRSALDDGAAHDDDPRELLVGAAEDFEALRTDFEDLAIGYAGWADLLLDRAEESERRGLRPFQVRAWRQESVLLYEEARSRSADPGLLIGHARALIELDEITRAEVVLAQTPEKVRDTMGFVAVEVLLREHSGDAAAVSELLREAVVGFPVGLEATPDEYPFRFRGAARLTTWPTRVTDATTEFYGGGMVEDVSFIPAYRGQWETDGVCLNNSALIAAVMTGEDTVSDEVWETLTPPPRLTGNSPGCLSLGVDSEQAYYESVQDMHRWAGDLDRAQELVAEWREKYPEDFGSHQRAGEVAYLQGEYETAQEHFEEAARRWEDFQEVRERPYSSVKTGVDYSNDAVLPGTTIALQIAEALSAQGETDEADDVLQEARSALDESYEAEEFEMGESYEASVFYLESQRGYLALVQGDDGEAVERLQEAVDMAAAFEEQRADYTRTREGDDPEVVLLRGAQENNLALALARSGDHEESTRVAEAALSRDPANPVFLDTLAFAHHLAGDTTEAAQAYQRVLDEDATSYVSANNLAVLVAQEGDHATAQELLRSAVAANPDYATGWHNLGVVTARLDGSRVAGIESALAVAGRLDRSQRGEPLDLVVDDTVYESGLDISKPLDPGWNYAQTASEPRHQFTLTMAVLIALQLLWALRIDRVVEITASRFGARTLGVEDRLPSWLWGRLPAFVGLAVSAGVLAAPTLFWADSWLERALLFGVVGGLVLMPWGVRRLAFRDALPVQFGWPPAMLVSMAAAPLGVTVAPYPGVDDDDVATAHRRRTLWAAAGSVAVVTAVFVALAFFSAVPLARWAAMAGLALLGSMLLPFRPFDGAHVRARSASALIAAVLLLGTISFELRWV